MVFLKKHFKSCCEEKKKRDRKGTEEALLRAACELFSEKGYENTRTLEIAKAAGANEALIARYFGGKEGLLTAIFKNETSFQSVIDSHQVHGSPFELFPIGKSAKELAQGILTFFANGKVHMQQKEQFIRIASSRAFVDPEMAEVVRTKFISAQRPKVVESLRTYLSKGTLSENELDAMAMLICSSNFSFNFMGRLVYKMEEEKIDLGMKILAESLQNYVISKS